MKFLLTCSAAVILVATIFIGGNLASCSKDHKDFTHDDVKDYYHHEHPYCDTLKIRDTVYLKDTVLTEALLTAHSWKTQEVRGVIGGDTIYYLRGGVHNTESFDNEYITFNADKTGSLHDNAGYSHAIISWDFANAEHTKIVMDIYNDNVIHSIYTWDNIRFKNNNLYYDDYFFDKYRQVYAHTQEIRIPL